MDKVKRGWKYVPDKPRRVLVFILGVLLILLAGIVGAVPGPGGMIIFLLGIAVLSTEFTWAQRLRDFLLDWTHRFGQYIKKRPIFSTVAIVLVISLFWVCAYAFYSYII